MVIKQTEIESTFWGATQSLEIAVYKFLCRMENELTMDNRR